MRNVVFCSDLLTVALAEVAKEEDDKSVELRDLLLVVVLQSVLVALLQPVEGIVHLIIVFATFRLLYFL